MTQVKLTLEKDGWALFYSAQKGDNLAITRLVKLLLECKILYSKFFNRVGIEGKRFGYDEMKRECQGYIIRYLGEMLERLWLERASFQTCFAFYFNHRCKDYLWEYSQIVFSHYNPSKRKVEFSNIEDLEYDLSVLNNETINYVQFLDVYISVLHSTLKGKNKNNFIELFLLKDIEGRSNKYIAIKLQYTVSYVSTIHERYKERIYNALERKFRIEDFFD